MIQRGGAVVLRLLDNVPQRPSPPLLPGTMAPGTCVDTEAYTSDRRWEQWGSGPESVCQRRGAYARDDDGDGLHEVHVQTVEGFWSLLRSWLRPHRGMAPGHFPRYVGCFAFVHNVRRRGKALLGAVLELLLT